MTELDRLRIEAGRLADTSLSLHKVLSRMACDQITLTKQKVGRSPYEINPDDEYAAALAHYIRLKKRAHRYLYTRSTLAWQEAELAREHCHDLVREAQPSSGLLINLK